MAKYFDYDPFTGMHETTDIDEQSGRVTIHQAEDVEPVLNQCKEMANCGSTDQGIKKGFWHYAEIPLSVVLELKKQGIDIHDRNSSKRLFETINRDYPYLKVTQKSHVQAKTQH